MITYRPDWYERPFLRSAFDMFLANVGELPGSKSENDYWILFVRVVESFNMVAPEFGVTDREFPWHLL